MSDHWTQAVINMKNALKKNNSYLQFMINFSPDENTGYVWSQNEEFRKISDFIENETYTDGHSGASFAICLRTSIQEIKNEMNNNIIDNELNETIEAQICNDDSPEYQEATIIYDLS